ncbi:RNA-binding transcriptional accessory protein [Virgibacillus halodenitrificans]|uniref:RNA-binding transcriptional accessory protein n=1 Tax=Virgibacillus halodenitrificans TaxID=1482 RepID=A0AAC9NML6_VIRHA|nr:Tex family protein [Virgibacillus halodenitrificans]APC50153.1 RNA-binding transcriptional accessory protein [Virgibacillus halodenitrificans]MCG1027282.1 RNA-binding transcriptional accessory protein [Virgibacillus halodenitrificans]MEC2159216.1 Tex family protein [Virgibacillus halodenitrificans]
MQLMQWVSKETKVNTSIVHKVIDLLDEGNTVPFIARYRKEITGGLDEVQIKSVQDKWTYAVNLSDRKQEVIRIIDEQGKLTEELEKEINEATQLQRVEDLYRPYKQKRRTKATIAKEKGLESLAQQVWDQQLVDLTTEVEKFISEEHELQSMEDVLAGVNDIIAEWISDDPEYREYIREETFKRGSINSELKAAEKDEKSVYEMYYEFNEAIRSMVSHRILALNRGEKEEVLKVTVEPPAEKIHDYLVKKVIKRDANEQIVALLKEAINDSYKRLIQPSVEREIRSGLTEKAEQQAIEVFSKNLNNLLLQPPLKGKTILGVDPAFRTGCKLAIVDETGKVLDVGVMYPTAPKHDIAGAEKIAMGLIRKHQVELIAIGNGTASRETEQFISDVISNNKLEIPYIIVNEAGASVYSASKLAREEFPDLQVEERSAASIARRVQDPLAELVKIDPKSIGVGQYQHDVGQKALNESLTFVVETAVNQVGVNVNTASSSLLQYVSGLSKAVANNIVKQRNEEGKFTNRKQLKKIPRLGAKTYEQGIGFLRIIDGDHPLDRTPIHPESYKQTEQLLKLLDCELNDIGSEKLREKVKTVDKKELAKELEIGEPTLLDIIGALGRPERDPRDDFPQPLLKQNVLSLEDLKPGMEMQGTVRNVVDFGVFVDIGVKQDGLVHISKMSNSFVKHPMDIASVGDVVTVWVEQIDANKGRIALSMIKNEK